jgi:hypothetical protein
MGVFKDQDEAARFIGRIWELLGDDADIGPKLAASNQVLRGSYTDPVYQVTITCKDGAVKVEHGENDLEADATLILTADTGHHFWLGAVNIPMALARGQIKADGKMSAIMKLLPILKPGYAIYRDHLVREGREDLLTK